MRIFKLVGSLVLVLTFGAIATAVARAAETLWRLLPGSANETFTGKGGLILFESNAGKWTCKNLSISLTIGGSSSELLENEARLALAMISLEGCRFGEIGAVNTVGDPKEVVLAHAEIHFCLIKKGDLGLAIKVLPIHAEIAAFSLSVELSGGVIALISALSGDKKHFELNVKQSKGKQEIEKCEGGEALTLTLKFDAKPVENVGFNVSEGLLLFDGTLDKVGEELMEN
jgi:hypothetical protein